MKIYFTILLSITAIAVCASNGKPAVTAEDWGSVDSKPVYLFTLTNSNGVIVRNTNFGGIVVEFIRKF